MARLPSKFGSKPLVSLFRTGPKTKPEALLEGNFPQQQEFILEPARLIACITPRRSGKSTAVAKKLAMHCLANPKAKVAYLALTKESCFNTLFPIFDKLHDEFRLPYEIKQRPLSIKFANGSKIFMYGISDNAREAEKLRGQSFDIIVIDEAGAMQVDLQEIINRIIKPLLWDTNGQLILISTPGHIKNYFHDITAGKTKDPWKIISWTALDNIYVSKNVQEEMEQLKANNPYVLQTSWYKNEYLGQWALDDSKSLYKYHPDRNYIERLPESKDYLFSLAVDPGFDDNCAFVLGCYSPTSSPCLYYLNAYRESKMYINDILEKLQEIQKLVRETYKSTISNYIIDTADKGLVEEIKMRSGIPFQPASKLDKFNSIYLMNDDFLSHRIKALPDAKLLVSEWLDLKVDDRDPIKPKEFRKKDGKNLNDCADAALYLWRASYHFAAQAPINHRPTFEERLEEWASNQTQQIDPLDQWGLDYQEDNYGY